MKKLIINSLCLVSVSVYAQTGGLRSEVGVPPPTVRAEMPRETAPSISNVVKPSMPAMNNEPARLTSSAVQANTNQNGGGQESGDNWLYPKSMTSSGGGTEREDNWLDPKSMTSSANDAKGQALDTSNKNVAQGLVKVITTNRAYEDSSPRTKAQQVGSNPLLVMPPSPSAGDATTTATSKALPSSEAKTGDVRK